ncbi:hypothetical protein FRC12_001490 [Ceratobasidium sp. 428]|nr:hypothetical protein FRC12_001490 [Ceratobasidium sp. 428]
MDLTVRQLWFATSFAATNSNAEASDLGSILKSELIFYHFDEVFEEWPSSQLQIQYLIRWACLILAGAVFWMAWVTSRWAARAGI